MIISLVPHFGGFRASIGEVFGEQSRCYLRVSDEEWGVLFSVDLGARMHVLMCLKQWWDCRGLVRVTDPNLTVKVSNLLLADGR